MKVNDKEILNNHLKGWQIQSAISSMVFHTVHWHQDSSIKPASHIANLTMLALSVQRASGRINPSRTCLLLVYCVISFVGLEKKQLDVTN